MHSRTIHTYYDNLKVSRNAPQEVIRAAYKSLAQKYHPDRNQNDFEAVRVMKLINEAYEVLSDPFKRAEHDKWIIKQEQINQNYSSKQVINEQRYNYSSRKSLHANYLEKLFLLLRAWFITLKDLILGLIKFMLWLTLISAIIGLTVHFLIENEPDHNSNKTVNDDPKINIRNHDLEIKSLPASGDSDNKGLYGVAPLRITVPYGDNYLVKIDDATTGNHLVSFFIRSGDTLETQMPLGRYNLKYAYGQQWYGYGNLFGHTTKYAQADSIMEFSSDEYGGYSGVSIELIKQVNGNLSTTNINANQF